MGTAWDERDSKPAPFEKPNTKGCGTQSVPWSSDSNRVYLVEGADNVIESAERGQEQAAKVADEVIDGDHGETNQKVEGDLIEDGDGRGEPCAGVAG